LTATGLSAYSVSVEAIATLTTIRDAALPLRLLLLRLARS
jgi:hypothetical protein